MAAPARFAAIIALAPAAANTALPVRGGALVGHLCGGGTISIPLDNPVSGSEGNACCAKGCRPNETRKRRNRLVR